MKNKVLLIRPNFAYVYSSFSKAGKFYGFGPPVGLLFIAAMLDEYGIDNSIIDVEIENYTEKEIINFIVVSRPKVVGFSATTPEIDYVFQLASKIKKVLPDVIIAIGGSHAIIMPEDVIRHENIDIVCNGEGEIAFSEFMNRLFNGNIDGSPQANIYYKFNNTIIKPRDKIFIEDLDSLPFQARYKLNYKKYTYPVPQRGRVPFAMVLSSRGCLYHCSFCCRIMGEKVRYVSSKRVVEEIEFIKKKYNTFFVQFNDDSFVSNREKVIKICRLLIHKNIGIKWYCTGRVGLLDDELLKIMQRAGCIKISLGIESANQKSLNLLNKEISPEDCRKTMKMVHKYGITTYGFFIIGIPYETKEDIFNTIKFAKELNFDEASFNIITPYPGTKLFKMVKNNSGIKLIADDFYQYRRWGNVVVELPGISQKALIKFQKYAIRSFYLRFGSILYQIKNGNFKEIFKTIGNYVFSIIK